MMSVQTNNAKTYMMSVQTNNAKTYMSLPMQAVSNIQKFTFYDFTTISTLC